LETGPAETGHVLRKQRGNRAQITGGALGDVAVAARSGLSRGRHARPARKQQVGAPAPTALLEVPIGIGDIVTQQAGVQG
jgi:hypothetical protein